MDVQGSLLDLAQEPSVGAVPSGGRVALTAGAWLDVHPGWLHGADALFDYLHAHVPWHAERRQMYDREVAVPRLLSFYREGVALPHPVLEQAREQLDARYEPELGEPFRTAGLCLYRDGRDSVAWHGDTVGRGSTHDTMVAIISVGAPRVLALRPRGGGVGHRVSLGHGVWSSWAARASAPGSMRCPRVLAPPDRGSASSYGRGESDEAAPRVTTVKPPAGTSTDWLEPYDVVRERSLPCMS